MGLNYIAFALILFVGYVRITPGPARVVKEVHKFEREAFKRTSEALGKIVNQDKVPAWLHARLTNGVELCETYGTLFLFSLLLDYRVATWLCVFLEIALGASQEPGSYHFLLSIALALVLVVLMQYRSFPFRLRDVSERLRDEIEADLATLQSEVTDLISATRKSLGASGKKVKSKNE
jgi:hypothetical protein